MKNRHGARAKVSAIPDKRVAAGRFRRIGIALIVAVAMSCLSLVVFKRLNSSSMPPRTATFPPQPEKPSLASEATLPDSEKDRALRSEQLQAAEKLLAEFP